MKNVLKGYRTMLGYTQQQMADLLDVSRQSYFMKESGRTPFKDSEKILIKKEIAKLFPSITIDEIFFSFKLGNDSHKEVK